MGAARAARRRQQRQNGSGDLGAVTKVVLPDDLADAIRAPVDPYALLGQKEAALQQKDRALGAAIRALGAAKEIIAQYEKLYGPLKEAKT